MKDNTRVSVPAVRWLRLIPILPIPIVVMEVFGNNLKFGTSTTRSPNCNPEVLTPIKPGFVPDKVPVVVPNPTGFEKANNLPSNAISPRTSKV